MLSFRRDTDVKELERALRARRSEPRDEFVAAVVGRSGRHLSQGRRFRAFPVALAAALTVALLAAVAAVGGIDYAGHAAKRVAASLKHAVNPKPDAFKKNAGPVRFDAGGDEYKPGFGWGDPNHTHTGPPGLSKPGSFTPPLVPKKTTNGKAYILSATFTIDEQADLFMSVEGPDGTARLLTQNGSSISGGGTISGRQTKHLRYRVLVPRTITVTIRVPASQLAKNGGYTLVVRARGQNGEVSILTFPFTVSGSG